MVAVVGRAPAAQLTVLTLARENKPGHRINSDTATHAEHWRSRIFKTSMKTDRKGTLK